jgi:hypothetical protein
MRAQTITSIQHARIARFTVAVVALVVALGGLAASARAEPAGNTVTEWNEIAASATIATAGQPPHVAPLSLGMVQGAVYDAVNAIDGGHQPYLAAPKSPGPASKRAAAATAAYGVLVGLFPTQQPTLKPRYDASLEAVPDGEAKAGGIAVGEKAAATMLAERANDGRFPVTPFPDVQGTDPGEWRKTPPVGGDPAPWVGNVRPFLVPDVEMLRTEGPKALTSAAYAEDYNEVKELGSLTSTRRTADQTAASIFWQDSGPAIWNRVFRQLATSEELNIVESARMFAMTNLASADGVIGCWNDKYYWNFWRPITAIREGGSDGNPATEADSGWKPLFNPTDGNGNPIPVSGPGHAGVPGPPVGARLPQRGHRADAEGVLRYRQDRLHGGEQQVLSRALSAEELRPLLGGDQGGDRRARVERHPLPQCGRARRGAGQEGGQLARQALFPAGQLTLK